MKLINAFIAWIFDPHPNSQERDDLYLAGAADMADLERRSPTLGERGPAGPLGEGA